MSTQTTAAFASNNLPALNDNMSEVQEKLQKAIVNADYSVISECAKRLEALAHEQEQMKIALHETEWLAEYEEKSRQLFELCRVNWSEFTTTLTSLGFRLAGDRNKTITIQDIVEDREELIAEMYDLFVGSMSASSKPLPAGKRAEVDAEIWCGLWDKYTTDRPTYDATTEHAVRCLAVMYPSTRNDGSDYNVTKLREALGKDAPASATIKRMLATEE